jgi:uncharacterized protein YdhG (YjbR/CyaY superfamily)
MIGESVTKAKPATVDEYIENAPAEAQERLRDIRAILAGVAPDASEAIKWNVPVFETDRILFSYSAHKTHINFMPTRTTLEAVMDEVGDFDTGRDTIKLPYDRPLPREMIKKVAEHRVREVEEGARWMHKGTE